ncbi:hypothetical protein [Streptomyces sp. NPDC005336]|uniref:hypothetical protein n=1 Tax=Streptomyces sp. NPDC005336 TaxID=3157035 RepID=UPI0033B91901
MTRAAPSVATERPLGIAEEAGADAALVVRDRDDAAAMPVADPGRLTLAVPRR